MLNTSKNQLVEEAYSFYISRLFALGSSILGFFAYLILTVVGFQAYVKLFNSNEYRICRLLASLICLLEIVQHNFVLFKRCPSLWTSS